MSQVVVVVCLSVLVFCCDVESCR